MIKDFWLLMKVTPIVYVVGVFMTWFKPCPGETFEQGIARLNIAVPIVVGFWITALSVGHLVELVMGLIKQMMARFMPFKR